MKHSEKDYYMLTSLLQNRSQGMEKDVHVYLKFMQLVQTPKKNAKILSKSVVTSSLTKAAIYGKDANWGRILCALGYAGVDFDPVKVDISLKSADGVIEIVKDGIATDYSEDEATKVLSADAVTVDIDVHNGVFEATAWGCDLTHDYVTINADYRS